MLSRYDNVLHDHLKKVKDSQDKHQRLQVHYLSKDIQNEFIECCAKRLLDEILSQIRVSKYYSIIVDATPDAAHM